MISFLRATRELRHGLALALGLSAAFSGAAFAESYPTRPVRILVGVAPGGVTDLAARIIGPKLGEAMGQPFVVENRPGASGAIAAGAAAKAAPDGYTLFLGNVADMAVNPVLMKELTYDTTKDFAPVVAVSDTALTVAVHPSVQARNLQELVAWGKAHPGKLAFASAGNGTVNQIVGEWINHDAGISMIHVPYKGGGPSTQDVLAGQVPVGILAVSAARPHAHAGKLKVLAVSSAKRVSFEPDWPTVAESGFPGFDASVWVALFAPASVPKSVVARLNEEVNRILKMPEIIAQFNKQGANVLGGSAQDLGTLMNHDRARYGRMLGEFNITAD